jgi:hypothetical protein
VKLSKETKVLRICPFPLFALTLTDQYFRCNTAQF